MLLLLIKVDIVSILFIIYNKNLINSLNIKIKLIINHQFLIS